MDEKIDAVQRMQNYIEKHLYENISMSELSVASMYSPWYSYKLFREILNSTPADYIRRLRLSKAALKLRDEHTKVIDVALDCGFLSVDGFQRAFFREFGCNPGEYVKTPVPLYLFIPYGAKDSKTRKEITMEKTKNIFIQIIEKPERKVIIKRGVKAEEYFDYCNEVGCDIWGLLVSMKSLCGEPVCMWLPQKFIKPGTSKYVQGVEKSSDFSGAIPEGFDEIILPASKYLMFKGEPFAEEDYESAILEVMNAIKNYDPKIINYEWDTENPRIQLEPIGERGYIELLPIKEIK